jgi:integrase
MFHLAEEWGRVERALPNIKMLPGEKHRERVLTAAEEDLYFRGASTDAMVQYADAALLRDVATVLLDCGLRPEECFRLRTENVADGKLEIHYGKTDNARRGIPMSSILRLGPLRSSNLAPLLIDILRHLGRRAKLRPAQIQPVN